MWMRAWHNLPWDGQGWGRCKDDDLWPLRCRSARRFRLRLPLPLRTVLPAVQGVLWPIAALLRAARYVRHRKRGLGTVPGLFRHMLLTGAEPMDAEIWYKLFGNLHPLPARAAGLLLTSLGDPAAHRLLSDKLALAQCLAASGLPVPLHVDLVASGSLTVQPPSVRSLFLKPRHGWGGSGTMFFEGVGDGVWSMEGGAPVPWGVVESLIVDRARNDDILIQERLESCPGLAALSAEGRPPVLRLTVARWPGQPAFLHSALLMVPVPGHSMRQFLKGVLYIPADPEDGCLRAGISLGDLDWRHKVLPWSGLPIAGLHVPDFKEAVRLALAAMDSIPPVPLVNWDLIISPRGPVLLEGNSVGNWILTHLPGLDGLATQPLPPVLRAWG